MKRARNLVFFWLPVIFWMGLIYFLSSFHKLQVSTVGWQDFITRKTAHFLEYMMLCILFNRGFKNTTNLSAVKRLFLSLFLTILYAVADEYHQTFVSGRTGKFFDVKVDFLGVLTGTVFSWKIVDLLPTKIKEVTLL